MFNRILLGAVLLVTAETAMAQWGLQGNCYYPTTNGLLLSPAFAEDTSLRWEKRKDWTGNWYSLYRGTSVVGIYDADTKKYWQWNNGVYAAVSEGPPIGVPIDQGAVNPVPAPKPKDVEIPNFGLDLNKLDHQKDGGTTYRYNGQVVPKAQAYQALANRFDDDSQKLRVTVISRDASIRKQVKNDFDNCPAELRDLYVFNAYTPDDFEVARVGFVTTGEPTIYCQAPSGKVLHRQDDYKDGAVGLQKALRRSDPNYDPKKDPDLRKPGPGPMPDNPPGPSPPSPSPLTPNDPFLWFRTNGMLLLVAFGLVAGSLYFLKRRSQQGGAA